ncbi:MAG TPA: ABC transporter permease [Hyphomicrobiales bacterium]|nr:ABC transporter permease [Hyphomicrobiales bacterium]
MVSYAARRLLGVIPVMLVVGVFVFMLLHLGAGDPAALIAGDFATPAQIAHIHTLLGLDQPLPVQFGRWGWNILHGNLGVSVFSGVSVVKLIGERIWPTLALAVSTIVFSCALSIPLGIFAAWRAGTAIDRSVMALAVAAFSFPVFLVGYAMMIVLGVNWHILPVQGYAPLSAGLWPFLSHLIMPTVTLGFVYLALLARITRASMVEVLSQDYIRTARAKGLKMRTVLTVHALKNAAVPIVTTIGNGIALLIGGAVVTETVFAIPGLGRLTVDAITQHDYPVIQGLILVFGGVYVVVNLLIDLAYTLLDPRIRY